VELRHLIAKATMQPERTRPTSRAWFTRAARKIAFATSLVPWRAECLEKSLALLFVAQRAGNGASLRIGVIPEPFEAHAWVEHEGQPVNDEPEHVRQYLMFPPIGQAAV
jgi:hypothetical protein